MKHLLKTPNWNVHQPNWKQNYMYNRIRILCRNVKNVPQIEIIEVLLVYWNLVKNTFQYDLRVLHKLKPIKSFQQSIAISTFDLEFSYIGEWFAYKVSQSLEMDGRINLTLFINWCKYIKNDNKMSCSIESRGRKYVTSYGVLPFCWIY